MAITEKKVLKIKAILEESKLEIPNYQRPYKWQAKHVNQLIEDILFHFKKDKTKSYRLGTVVLHEDNEINVVDGQQRLLTLTLLCYLLGEKKENLALLKSNFNAISQENILRNKAVIEARLKSMDESQRKDFPKFILEQCEVVCITLSDLSEAFQFFDSQNSRGKSLEPYDLLKAYHLREMDDCTQAEKLHCVELWEKSVAPKQEDAITPLKTIFDRLYRIRRWVNRQRARSGFTKDNIDVFKGVNLDKGSPYRFTQAMLMADILFKENSRRDARLTAPSLLNYPFLIDQVLINGKRFFEYIDYYQKQYQALRNESALKELWDLLNTYEGHWRTGDGYVRTLFECAALYHYDKFGGDQLKEAMDKIFIWSYSIRLINSSVRIESIDNAAIGEGSIFPAIQQALNPSKVVAFAVKAIEKVEASKAGAVRDHFQTLGYLENAPVTNENKGQGNE